MRLLLATFLLSVLFLSVGLMLLFPSSIHATNVPTCIPSAPPSVPSGTTAVPLPEETGVISINEVLTNPGKILWNCDSQSTSGRTNIWIELYNPSDWTYNLTDNVISIDEGPGTTSFLFPQEAIIAPHGYFVFFPYAYIQAQTQDSPITQYRLMNHNTVISTVEIPQLTADYSYSYFSGATQTPPGWEVTPTPTMGNSNTLPLESATPTKGSTPTKSSATQSASGKTKSGSSSSSSSKGTATTKPVANGTQPAWDKLNRPENVSSQKQEQPALASSVTAPEADLPRQIIMSTLAISLIAGAYGGIRFFARRRIIPPDSGEE